MRLNSRWTVGLTEEGKKELEAEWRNSRVLRKTLLRLLTEDVESSIIRQEGEDFIKNPNLLVAHADQQGYRRGLRQAIKLIQQDIE